VLNIQIFCAIWLRKCDFLTEKSGIKFIPDPDWPDPDPQHWFLGNFFPPRSGSRDPIEFVSPALAFDVLSGSVQLVLLLLVERVTKTTCPIPLFDSLCFPCPTWQRPPGAVAAGGRSDKEGMSDTCLQFSLL
jgi:hypothetical protein